MDTAGGQSNTGPETDKIEVPVQARLRAAGLADIDEKLRSSERLTLEDGVRLFESPDLLAVGYLANREREKRHGARTYFNYNLRLEPTNVCEATCLFCSFSRLQEGMPEAYTMSLEQAWDKLRQRAQPAAHRGARRQRPQPAPAVQLLHGAAARLQADPARRSI